IHVMKLQRGMVTAVTALVALAAHHRDQLQLSRAAAFVLLRIALVVVVGVAVLAAPPAESGLTALEQR
ncbi:MAG TPA: hypothetical protein VFR96_07735, partial [Povalibacter sp.]|nr:hypothetical protein [Povalibacter sp.]